MISESFGPADFVRPPFARKVRQAVFASATVLLSFVAAHDAAGANEPLSGPAILAEMESFRELGGVLYVAAHPDDENTQLIAALARGRRCRMAYLSVTRGDGGQNVLGPEFGDELGVIRTQELLAARRVDGGRQFFTRAIDFGFSKDLGPATGRRRHRPSDPDLPAGCRHHAVFAAAQRNPRASHSLRVPGRGSFQTFG
jgi:hypothetical protein